MITLKIGDIIKAEVYGYPFTGEVIEITNNGCYIDEGNFIHRDNITHVNGKPIN